MLYPVSAWGRSGSFLVTLQPERETDLPGRRIQPAADHGPGAQVPGRGQGEAIFRLR